MSLAWQDHLVVAVYLVGMLALGGVLALKQFRRRQRSIDNEYFLAGRRMPWLAVGISVIASLLSSLTYLSEPGEVWNSGVTHVFGKMLAIPFEMLIVWTVCIPFMMRFRFTSAYEYLEHRFGRGARWLGVVLFISMVVLWMGFVVLASARALSIVSGVPLLAVIATVGAVATIYTMVGGLRAVIWTDVVQVVLLIGGGLFAIGFVMATTGTWLTDWYASAATHLSESGNRHDIPVFSLDPRVRATVITVALNMCIWHICTHTGNQMTVQRYYATSDMKAARRSFVTCSVFSVGINMMLVVVGLAVLYYYFGQHVALDADLDPTKKQDRDLIFPTFAVHQLPAGLGGAILAALLAAAMSSIDSGVNSIATVLTVEIDRNRNSDDKPRRAVRQAMTITLVAGLFITVAAYALSFLPKEFGIVDAMPRTFNAITGPLGGLFLVGMFIRRASGRVAVAATICGLATSLFIGYFNILLGAMLDWGLVQPDWLAGAGLLDGDGEISSLSFTWPMPCALAVTMGSAWLFSRFGSGPASDLPGLTWYTRHEKSPLTSDSVGDT